MSKCYVLQMYLRKAKERGRQQGITWINEGNIFLFCPTHEFNSLSIWKHLQLQGWLYYALHCDFSFGNKTLRKKKGNRLKDFWLVAQKHSIYQYRCIHRSYYIIFYARHILKYNLSQSSIKSSILAYIHNLCDSI